jgi:hypothetical protein
MRIIISLVLVMSGCTTYKTAANMALVSMVEDASPGKSIGPLAAKDCATSVFGYGRSVGDLSVDKALERGGARSKFRYINNMSIDNSSTVILVYQRTCLEVKGQGYQ